LTEVSLPQVVDTERLGSALALSAPWSKAGPQVVYLQGELGSGKTTLARGLLRALGVTGTVRSPSYTLLESYEPMGHRVLHVDLYRLSDSADLATLGLRDEWVPGTLMLIEWPERAEGLLPTPDLGITLHVTRDGRMGQLAPMNQTGIAWLTEAMTRFTQN
jgi:tRNA threonylcarbamoyladenosine biosynthesis protein TsaE